MLQYMIILLDDASTSFCHYEVPSGERRLIHLDDLRAAIRLAMIENLTIQFVYPDYELPQEYQEVIDTIDHSDIKPLLAVTPDADVVTINGWEIDNKSLSGRVAVLRTAMSELLAHTRAVKDLLAVVQRLNVVITDLTTLTDTNREAYMHWLNEVGQTVVELYINGQSPQFNLLTDRMMLAAMNNCGAGDTCITLAPNGRFYVCPGFYYDDPENDVGDLRRGFDIKNRQLYKLNYAPICRQCDAWQCRRCVWLNRHTTLEVNTPSHEQCVAAHLERNASRQLLTSIRQKGTFLPDKPEINEIDYLDPFEKLQER
ncbi:MAG: CXXX repeat peptide maturase [Muribaculaceae bacterium]|nr:CXXX repeat peptide maturase [Muribaculaceae bacterium]